MRAMVYHGPGRKAWEEVPDPEIADDLDAIVRVDATTICGTDLAIVRGSIPSVRPGRVLGHEAVGTVDEVGDRVRTLRPGDRVLVSCISSCGACHYCRQGRYGQCLGGGGWLLGHTADGTQAEYVRVPLADTSACVLPGHAAQDEALMLADLLPAGYEVGVLNGRVRPGDVVAVVGTGPAGLAAITCARLFSPSRIVAVDIAESRRAAAKEFGADVTVDPAREDARLLVRELSGGLGADVAIEAAGQPDAVELAVAMVRPGGRVACIGTHAAPATLHLEQQWHRDITITTGLVDTSSTSRLLRLVTTRQIDARPFITHHFGLDEFQRAYDMFANGADNGALKVVLSR